MRFLLADRPQAIYRFVLGFLALSVCLYIAAKSHAVEQAEAFVKGLQERGLHDETLDYLDRMETSRLVGEAFRRQIPYYRGVTLIEKSRQTVDPEVQARLLDEAREKLEKYTEANPTSVEAAEAQLQLATVLVEQGKKSIARVEQLPPDAAYDAQRNALREEAREAFAEAQPMFAQVEEIYAAELERIPSTLDPETDNAEINRRQEYRGRLAQVRVMAGQARFELAQTHPAQSDEYRRLHEAAAEELAMLYEEHSRWLVGFYARLYEGRCYQALGQHRLALGCYDEILAQPNTIPAFRQLMAKAQRHRIETLLAQVQVDAAIENASAWLQEARPTEEKQPDWLAVRYRLAEALERRAESYPADSLDRRKVLAEARDAYRTVSAWPNEFQAAARSAVASMGRAADDDEHRQRPSSFRQAYELGKEAMASMNAARLALPTAEQNNPDAVPELAAQIEEGKEDARHFFQAAMSLVEDDTETATLNEVRYFLCWLHYDDKDYYRAAVLGEFLARRYPDHPAAAAAAKLAMASYEQLQYQSPPADAAPRNNEFEARRMAEMADFITRRWPNTDDADAAFGVLVSHAIRTGRVEEAEKMLAKDSDESRPRLVLQLGTAMWAQYLARSQPNAGAAADEPGREGLKQNAIKFMRSGFDAARSQREADELVATAGLYLTQSLLDDGDFAAAIKLLDDPKFGPLTLVEAEHPAAEREGYAIETYKAALRAYLSVSPPQTEKAVAIMDALERAFSRGEQAPEQLTRIYLGLGVALQQQLDALRSAGRDGDAARVASAFGEFLDRIAARQHGAGWSVRAWIAQTYYDMAVGPQPQRAGSRAPPRSGGRTPTGAESRHSKELLIKARDALRGLIKTAEANAGYAPNENAVLAAKVQLGECYRELGAYKAALAMFSSILKEKETSLAVQRAAALTYQQRGDAEDHRWYERAIYGGHKLKSTGKNRIWGWLKLAQVAQRASQSNPAFRDAFFEARLNAARCRYLAGMKQQGAARQEDLAKAKQSVRSMMQLYPNLGGDRWRSEFEALLKDIQHAIDPNEKPVGLQEFATTQS